MRCWDCKAVIVLPEIIMGEPGVAGSIRADTIDRDRMTPQVATQEIACSRCGSQYMLTTAKKPGNVPVTNKNDDRESERTRGWR